MVAVYSTKNIWLVQADKLPRTFIRTLELRRKPIAVDILDDGTRLAVLSNPHKVDLYRLQDGENTTLERMKSVILTVDANTIALSPDGMVLATGYQFGIELISLAEKASEHDRRSVNCDPMDHLAFSDDGRTLLATTSAKLPRSTTLFTVHGAFDGPFTEDGELIPQECHVAWTRQILFPEKAVTAKQALLLPDTITGQVNELFAFDAEEDSWGIYDLAGVQFVETKEPPPEVGRFMRAESLEDALPAVSPSAEHVAVAVKQQDANSIWLYRLPDAYESNAAVYRDLRQHSDHHTPVAPCAYISLQRPEDTSSQDISAMRWLSPPSNEPSSTERLLAVGNVVWNTTPDTPIMPGETAKTTGILIMMDFDFSQGPDACGRPDNTKRIEIDLDEALPGEKLPEDDIDFEREVELVRTRTVAQKRGEAARAAARNSLLRSSSTTSPASASRNRVPSPLATSARHEEASPAFEEPYSHGQPRSQMSLNRAATVAAAAPANRRHLRALPNQPLEYRRADGLREIPHESDADNWVPPPPPYTESADPPGPGAMSISLSHPMGVSLPTIPQSPPAQHTSLPRLRIPAIPQSVLADTSNHSAPPVRQDADSPSGFHPTYHNNPRSAHPLQQSSGTSHRSRPSGQSARPLLPRTHTSPTRPSTSPPPTQPTFTFHHISASAHPSYQPEPEFPSAHAEPSAYQATANYLAPQIQRHQNATDPPSPTSAQTETFRRRDSVPTPVPPGAGWGGIGVNHRAAQSADDLGRSRGNRVGRRGRSNLSRLATIRSTNSGSSAGARRANSTPNLIEINAREREKDRSDFDRVKEGMRKLRCIVM